MYLIQLWVATCGLPDKYLEWNNGLKYCEETRRSKKTWLPQPRNHSLFERQRLKLGRQLWWHTTSDRAVCGWFKSQVGKWWCLLLYQSPQSLFERLSSVRLLDCILVCFIYSPWGSHWLPWPCCLTYLFISRWATIKVALQLDKTIQFHKNVSVIGFNLTFDQHQLLNYGLWPSNADKH